MTQVRRERLIRFAQAVHAGLSQTSAAEQCGLAKKGPGLRAAASRAMKEAVVVEELARLRGIGEKQAIAKKEEAERILTNQLRAGIGEFMRDGEFDLEAIAKAGNVVKAVTISPGKFGTSVRVELNDSQGAIDRLAKLNGWYKPEKTEVTVTGPKPENLTDAELAAETRLLLKELEKGGAA